MERKNVQHTVIIPSYNTLYHLKNTIKSIEKYYPEVKMIIIDDNSEDGTKEYLNKINNNNIKVIISSERRGHTYWYDEGMRQAETDIVSILHSDMIIGPKYFENLLKHLAKGKVVCGTRIEPPIHPAGLEKHVQDFGSDYDDFKWEQFENFCNTKLLEDNNKTTRGIFAPWMLYKEDHFAIGGHDQRFCPYGYEDSDIFNRWILAGYEMIQSRDALCYHMTCRGHRWNKGVGVENSDYKSTMSRCRNEFIRKWGDWIQNDSYQYPIINPKYDIGIEIKNTNENILQALEVWCSNMNVDINVDSYIEKEQKNTIINLTDKFKKEPLSNDIKVSLDARTFNQNDYIYIQQLPQIIKDNGSIGEFKLGNLNIVINAIKEQTDKLIKV